MIGLLQVDGKYPNLALMKIASYYRNLGENVELYDNLKQYDKIFVSKIFTFTEDYQYYINAPVVRKGGSGYDLFVKLSNKIENCYPAYDLFHCNYAMGFTTRGCIRHCPFCIVHDKEGQFRIVSDIYSFWQGQKQIKLLDNILNADENHFKLILNQVIKEKIQIDFSQGLDIRLLSDLQAHLLSKVRLWKYIHWAWDYVQLEKIWLKKIEILKKHKLINKSMCYVLIGYNTTKEEDYFRVMKLREWGIRPFVMPYDKTNRYQRNFARWVNHKAIFFSVDWKEYKYNTSKKLNLFR